MVQGNQPDFSPVKVECFKFSMFEERPEQDVEKVRSVASGPVCVWHNDSNLDPGQQ